MSDEIISINFANRKVTYKGFELEPSTERFPKYFAETSWGARFEYRRTKKAGPHVIVYSQATGEIVRVLKLRSDGEYTFDREGISRDAIGQILWTRGIKKRPQRRNAEKPIAVSHSVDDLSHAPVGSRVYRFFTDGESVPTAEQPDEHAVAANVRGGSFVITYADIYHGHKPPEPGATVAETIVERRILQINIRPEVVKPSALGEALDRLLTEPIRSNAPIQVRVQAPPKSTMAMALDAAGVTAATIAGATPEEVPAAAPEEAPADTADAAQVSE